MALAFGPRRDRCRPPSCRPRDRLDLGAVAAEDVLHRHLISPTVALARAASTARASRLPVPRLRRPQRLQRGIAVGLIALGLQAGQLLELLGRTEELSTFSTGCVGILGLVAVDADHALAIGGIDAGLGLGGGFLDAQLGDAGLDGLGHAAERLDLLIWAQALTARSWVRRST
jgi:hypothetical protein